MRRAAACTARLRARRARALAAGERPPRPGGGGRARLHGSWRPSSAAGRMPALAGPRAMPRWCLRPLCAEAGGRGGLLHAPSPSSFGGVPWHPHVIRRTRQSQQGGHTASSAPRAPSHHRAPPAWKGLGQAAPRCTSCTGRPRKPARGRAVPGVAPTCARALAAWAGAVAAARRAVAGPPPSAAGCACRGSAGARAAGAASGADRRAATCSSRPWTGNGATQGACWHLPWSAPCSSVLGAAGCGARCRPLSTRGAAAVFSRSLATWIQRESRSARLESLLHKTAHAKSADMPWCVLLPNPTVFIKLHTQECIHWSRNLVIIHLAGQLHAVAYAHMRSAHTLNKIASQCCPHSRRHCQP